MQRFTRRLAVVSVVIAVLGVPFAVDAAPAPRTPTDSSTSAPDTSAPDTSAPSTTAPPTTAPNPCALTYTVRAGDSWSLIASRHQVSVDALYTANRANSRTMLYAGRVLCLPPGAVTTTTTTAPPPVCAGTYVVRSGDGWQRIANIHGVTLTALLGVNRATRSTPLFVGRSICLPEGFTTTTTAPPTTAPPTTAGPTTTVPGTNPALAVPPNSGTGRRAIYSKTRQRVWAVEADGRVTRTYLVSGKMAQPRPGTYKVFSRSGFTCSLSSKNVCMRYMVRFARNTTNTDNIGFHEIPKRGDVPLQRDSQLGRPLSGGCIRQGTSDAQFMWNWAGIGTTVVVLP